MDRWWIIDLAHCRLRAKAQNTYLVIGRSGEAFVLHINVFVYNNIKLSIPCNNIGTAGLVSLTKAMEVFPKRRAILVIYGQFVRTGIFQLIARGTLLKEHTDVFPYEVYGHFYLAEVFSGLRRHYYWMPIIGENGDTASNAALELNPSHSLDLQPC